MRFGYDTFKNILPQYSRKPGEPFRGFNLFLHNITMYYKDRLFILGLGFFSIKLMYKSLDFDTDSIISGVEIRYSVNWSRQEGEYCYLKSIKKIKIDKTSEEIYYDYSFKELTKEDEQAISRSV